MTILNHTFKDSTLVSSCSYDDESKELVVTFVSGRSYTYIDVDRSDYEDLLNAPSVGRQFNSIKKALKLK